jgi:signal transduction histidine kinase
MKKKIYFGIFFLILCFMVGGYYIGSSNNRVTDQLETIILLERVDFLRKNLQNKVGIVQGDLMLKDSPHARNVDIFVQHVEEMHAATNVCLDCHHEEAETQRISLFDIKIDTYMKKLSRVYTLRANNLRLDRVKKEAFEIGQSLLEEIKNIIVVSSHKTSERTIQARENIEETKKFLIGLIIIGPIIILLLVVYFSKNFTKSITSLTTATRKIKEGELDYRIKDQLKDEFHELATSFNEMSSSLKEQQIRIQKTECLAAVGELSAGLVHEIKNPLAGIKVAIEVLKNELDLEQEDKKIFLRVINEINRIESLLRNLLNYARPSKTQHISVNLHEILDGIIKTSGFSIKNPKDPSRLSKDINFTSDFDSDIKGINADPAQLQQVLLNLVLNAADAIKKQGTINIKTTKNSDKSVEIEISDTGQGIDRESINMVFNPFFTTKSTGTGLGLSICKRLIEQHNGTISVLNNPGGGTVFVITLPGNKEK